MAGAPYTQKIFEEWLPKLEIYIPEEMKWEAVRTILEEHDTELELDEFMNEYLLLIAELQKTEEYGHTCTFMFADVSDLCIYSSADHSLYSMIDMYMVGSNGIRAKKCGRVSIDESEYIEFDEYTTLHDLGLENEGYEKLEFNCQFVDE
ncbi:hypothetical protein H4R24_001903 [Coemansia sp. RSA 988]|nr:hypothetical protein H4R24_001903 [Coemansia sp. RSA 988]